jgi:type I restriction enzyme S subunit
VKDTAPFPVEGLEILFKAQTATSVLREIVFKLAMMGRLAKQDPREGTGEDAIAACRSHRQRLVARGKLRNPAALPNVSPDERLFVVPETWAWTRFGEIGDWGSGATPSRGNSAYYGGKTPWLKSGELNDGYVDQAEEHVTDSALRDCSLRLNSPGDVLIAMYGATIGKVALLRTVATTNQAVCACTCFEGIDNEFLLRLLRAYKSIFVDQGAGGAQPNISKVKIVETPCPVPPLAEQKRIVAKVDQLMALCDDLEAKQTKKGNLATQSTRSALTALTTAETPAELATAWARVMGNFDMAVGRAGDIEELRTTIMGLAIRGALTDARVSDGSAGEALRRLAPNACEGAESIDDEPFPLPPTWAWSHLGDLCSAVHYGFTASADKTCRGVRLLRITDIQNDRVQWDAVPGCQIEPSRLPSYQLSEGDLLIARTGGTIGKTYLVSGLNCTAVFASYLIRAVPVPPIVPAYLKIFAGSHLYWRQLHAGSAGTGQPNVNATTLKSLLVPVPPPAEQKRIVAMVDQMMALCDDLEAKLRKQEETATRLAESLAAAVAA